jgi:threonine dehydrogenase-like Zn-dependent dehydrogenase
MKQLVQNYKNGKLELKNVPAPKLSKGNAIVKNYCSAVSIGTETLMIDLAKKSLAGKAFARPDLVKKVIEKLKNEGLKETYSQVMNRLDEPIALGYSSAGIIEKMDPGIEKFKQGDRVACSVPDYACHAEMVRIPENLMARIPDNVDFEEACFSAIGAIAIHSIRLSEVTLNNRVAVIGLGLLGQIAAQVLNAMSCDVSGFEIDEEKIKLARKLGLEKAIRVKDDSLFSDSLSLTQGFGFDAVIIATNTPKSKKPVEMACHLTREKGKVVLLGQADITMDRKILFQKELDFKVSRSTGPGILDEEYISKGIEYPISYIRWTHKRNMETFLDLLSKNRINIKDLITHQFEFSEVLQAYDSILNSKGKYIGVYLKYQSEGIQQKEKKEFSRVRKKHANKKGKGKINIGVIGAGRK